MRTARKVAILSSVCLLAMGACSSPATPAQTDSASIGTATPTTDDWPDESDTGVPDGKALTPFSGSCTITEPNTVIDGMELDCDAVVLASNVTIKNSKVNGVVSIDTDRPGSDQWSLTLEDSEVNAGPKNSAAVSNGNLTIRRSNIHGGQTSVQCTELSKSCTIEDSWLHGQSIPPMTTEPHLGGFLSSGGPNITLRHNRVACDASDGCTGDINLLPDFGPITNVLIENNLLVANDKLAYCTYGGSRPNAFPSDNIIYKGNIFERGSNNQCGAYGPVTGFDATSTGNQWTANTWDDGASLVP